jgi:CDP-diacylglycerol--serine O-phosphatidyltransferase
MTKQPRKGVYLLPNLMTTGAVFAGFYSIIAGIGGEFISAAIAVVVAGFLDGLDGRLARLTNTQSDFGTQYDSLSDLISFGVAPALLMYNWSLSFMKEDSVALGKLGWLAAFLYVALAALRLARFNTQAGIAEKSYFQGLATPAAAGTMVSTIWFCADQGISGESVRWIMWFLTVGLALLMFSQVRYFSGKAGPKGDKVSLFWIFVLVLIFVLLAIDPPSVFLAIGVIYVSSGLILTLLGKYRSKARRNTSKETPK